MFIKILIYLISVIVTIVVFFYVFASGENGLAYRLASKIIGQAPRNGDGAFQYPLGWFILLVTGTVLGSLIGYWLNKYLGKN